MACLLLSAAAVVTAPHAVEAKPTRGQKALPRLRPTFKKPIPLLVTPPSGSDDQPKQGGSSLSQKDLAKNKVSFTLARLKRSVGFVDFSSISLVAGDGYTMPAGAYVQGPGWMGITLEPEWTRGDDFILECKGDFSERMRVGVGKVWKYGGGTWGTTDVTPVDGTVKVLATPMHPLPEGWKVRFTLRDVDQDDPWRLDKCTLTRVE